MGSIVGTVLWLGGILIGTLAGLAGLAAAAAEAFGAEIHEVVYVSTTAALWLLVGAYYAWWGNRIQEGH